MINKQLRLHHVQVRPAHPDVEDSPSKGRCPPTPKTSRRFNIESGNFGLRLPKLGRQTGLTRVQTEKEVARRTEISYESCQAGG